MDILIGGFSAISIIMGLTEVVKRIGLPIRFVPIFSVFTGGIAVGLLNGFTSQNVITGIVLGLASCGLWSASKTIAGK